MTIALTKIAETSSTITLGWEPPDGVGAYAFYAAGQIVSVATANMKDGSPRNTVKFSKTSPGPPFEVAALCRSAAGVYTVEADAYPDASPPPAGQPIPADGVIRAGGTYSGSFSKQVSIATSAPVTLSRCDLTYKDGTIIRTSGSVPPDLTIDHCTIDGDTWRLLDVDAFKRIVMTNCTIEKTAGITLVGNGEVRLLRNRHHNIQRVPGGVGNFVQFRLCQTGTFEVGWNEVVNEYNKSNPEDLISIYHSSNIHVFDNMFWGQFHPGNGPGSSQNGITVDGYGGSGQPCNNNLIERNQVVRALSIAVFPTATGPCNNNMFKDNRCVHAGYLDDGVTRFYYGQHGMHVLSGGTNNHAHGNVLGFMRGSSQGSYARGTDGAFEGTPEGNSGEWANNTHLEPYPGNITRAHEDAEWDRWVAKKAAAGVTVGA